MSTKWKTFFALLAIPLASFAVMVADPVRFTLDYTAVTLILAYAPYVILLAAFVPRWRYGALASRDVGALVALSVLLPFLTMWINIGLFAGAERLFDLQTAAALQGLVIAPIFEEGLKLMILLWFFAYVRTSHPRPYALFFAALVVGAGFAASQNLFYFQSHDWDWDYVLLRMPHVLRHAAFVAFPALGIASAEGLPLGRRGKRLLVAACALVGMLGHAVSNSSERQAAQPILFAVLAFFLIWALVSPWTERGD